MSPGTGTYSITYGDLEIMTAKLKNKLFQLDTEFSCWTVIRNDEVYVSRLEVGGSTSTNPTVNNRGCPTEEDNLKPFTSSPSLGLEGGRKENVVLCPIVSGVMQEVKDAEPCNFDQEILYDYHRRSGHIDFKKCLKQLKMKSGELPVCPDCSLMKLKRGWYPSETKTRATVPSYRLHVDCSGRKRATLSGHRYYMMVVDDYSRKKWVLPLKHKSDTFTLLKNHLSMIERNNPKFKVARIRTDGGGEFVSTEMNEYLKDIGIQREISSPYCQYQNGVAERAIGIIDGSAKAMMSTATSPTYDWFFAVQYAAFLMNYANSGTAERTYTPNSLYEGVDRNVRFNGVFGCLVYAKVYIKGKQEPESRRCIFLGCDEVYKAAIVRDVTAFSRASKEYHARDLKFDVNQFPYQHQMVPRPSVPPLDDEDMKEIAEIEMKKEEPSDSKEDQGQIEEMSALDLGDEMDEKHVDIPTLEELEAIEHDIPDLPEHVHERRNPTRAGRGTSGKALEKIVNQSHAYLTSMDQDPETRAQALSAPDSQLWIEAEKEELTDIAKMGTWTLVDLPPGAKALGSRFVYKRKRNPDGSILKRKVRLVVKGFSQRFGIDYEDTFASMVTMQSIKLLFFLMTFYRLHFWKLDIRTFFLYGECKEEIYMEQPKGYVNSKKPKAVCRLHKTLYGMKQAMREANSKLREIFLNQKILPLSSDENVYYWTDGTDVMLFGVFVDDILFLGSNQAKMDKFYKEISQVFDMTVEKEPTTYLKFEIERDIARRYFKMHQKNYTVRLLEQFQMSDCAVKTTPYSTITLPHPRLVKTDKALDFQSLLGKLIWLTNTRPDLLFPVGVLCRYMSSYDLDVWTYAKSVLKYLKGTAGYGIVYNFDDDRNPKYGQGITLTAQVDSDWGGRIEDSKSTTGFTVSLNDVCIHAKSKMQKRPALSTPEAETNGAEMLAREIEWYRAFLQQLGVVIDRPTNVSQDNQTTIRLTEDGIMHARTKYYRITQHYLRWCVSEGILKLEYRPSKEMWCDLLNKGVDNLQFQKHLSRLIGDQQEQIRSVLIARTKSCSRKPPPGLIQRLVKEKQKAESKSNHDPPLHAQCYECGSYRRWCAKMNGWVACQVGCKEGSMKVSCVRCNAVANLNHQLNQWYCGCEEKRRPVRNRVITNRFLP
jgi:hypothetical protein